MSSSENKCGFWTKVKQDFSRYPVYQSKFSHIYKVILFERGFHMLFLYRVQQALRKIPVIGTFAARILHYISSCLYASEVSIFCEIEGGVYIPHASGIVIANDVVIKKGVTILQGVTIGRQVNQRTQECVIENDAILAAGCKVIGSITVGKNAIVGANAVVLKDVPDDFLAVGVPAVLKKKKLKDAVE